METAQERLKANNDKNYNSNNNNNNNNNLATVFEPTYSQLSGDPGWVSLESLFIQSQMFVINIAFNMITYGQKIGLHLKKAMFLI